MRIVNIKAVTSHTWAIQSDRWHEFIPGTDYPAYGIALLWFAPERRLSLSLWNTKRSTNIRLYGPRKLSWER